ncbi:MAG: hypothetical protein LEGION0398_MBIBDBAK_00563 [Legionellaceae bacterium]
MLYGLLNLSFWGYFIATLVLTHMTIACVTIYLHRNQAHRALDLHPIISHFFRFWLWLTTGTVTKEWTAVHRKHHAKCETPEDPHSPQVVGLKKVLFYGYELYKAATKDEETLKRFGHGTPDDWIERNLYTRYSNYGVVLMLLLDILFFGLPGITIWSIQMMWIPFFAGGVVNGVGHFWGYRNFECLDAATNIFPWGILIGGEELHNNHHTYGSSAKLSVKWFEFDIGWAYIKLLSYLRLAKIKKLPPKLLQEQAKSSIDIDTLKAVIMNRFQILSHYTKDVMLPVWKEEKEKAGIASKVLLNRAKKVLTRAEILLDETSKEKLTDILTRNQTLQSVYQYRERLQAIWNKTTANQKELIELLQDWCKHAEASGIEALRIFSHNLKTYTLAKVNLQQCNKY